MSEEFYDNKIAPKLKEVGDLCAKYGVPFLAVAEYAPGKVGRTAFQTNEECIEMVMIRHCAKTAPNIDGYVIGLMRWAREKNINTDASIVMRQLTDNKALNSDP
ncbi:unnamed protein product [marine sediment metagenome]|uniref:Uncharacterized protein n=1 Tax=marine sediment metagenome TaxID=412755 RepID=X1CSU8_9ZZZZ